VYIRSTVIVHVIIDIRFFLSIFQQGKKDCKKIIQRFDNGAFWSVTPIILMFNLLCNQRLNCSCHHGKWWANCPCFLGTRIRLVKLFIYPSVYRASLRTNNSQGTSMWLQLRISLVNGNKLSTSFVIVLPHYWVEYNWNHDFSHLQMQCITLSHFY